MRLRQRLEKLEAANSGGEVQQVRALFLAEGQDWRDEWHRLYGEPIPPEDAEGNPDWPGGRVLLVQFVAATMADDQELER